MKLTTIAQRLAEASDARFEYDAERCLHSRDRTSGCDLCVAVCPVNAIQPGKPPLFDADACQACWACLPACPMEAFGYSGIDTVAALIQAVKSKGIGRCELLCSRHPEPSQGVPGAEVGIRLRGCLAGLGTPAYLTLASLGVETIVARADACGDCPWSALRPRIEGQVRQARALLALWARPDTVRLVGPEYVGGLGPRPFWSAESPPRSRRDLFRPPSSGGPAMTGTTGDDGFSQRRRTLKALTQLGPLAAEADPAVPLDGLGFATMAVSEACTACGTCARACPTGAIAFETERSHFKLSVTPPLCIGCDICQHVCAPDAISLDHEPTFEQVFGPGSVSLLREGSLDYCKRCGAPFAAREGQEHCPVCEFRRKNPFGSMLPPGLARARNQGSGSRE